jgi:hypothetical protein
MISVVYGAVCSMADADSVSAKFTPLNVIIQRGFLFYRAKSRACDFLFAVESCQLQ